MRVLLPLGVRGLPKRHLLELGGEVVLCGVLVGVRCGGSLAGLVVVEELNLLFHLLRLSIQRLFLEIHKPQWILLALILSERLL